MALRPQADFIISVTSRNDEIARLVETFNCGFVIEPGNIAVLAQAIRYLATDTETGTAMGRRARDDRAEYSRRQAFARGEQVIKHVAQSSIVNSDLLHDNAPVEETAHA